MARLVGAPTPAIRPILDISAFCTNSKFNLPEHAINWERLSINFFLWTCPISLSRAVGPTTDYLIAKTSLWSWINELAGSPQCVENSDCVLSNSCGGFKILFLLRFR